MSVPNAGDAGIWRLGARTVHRLGLGTMRLTGTQPFHAGEPRDRAASVGVLRRAVELGVDHIDTAAFYFSRTLSAPDLVAEALAPYDDHLTIATKVGPSRSPDGAWLDEATPEDLRGQVEDNLRLLRREHLDLVYFRAESTGPITAHVEALVELVTEGLIGRIGVSGVELAQLEQALAVTDVVAVQNRFAIGAPGDVAVLRRCGQLGIAFVPFFTLAGAGKHRGAGDEPDAVAAVALETAATPAQVRLAWTLALGEHVLVIPGTGDVHHLEDNVAAAALHLTPAQLDRLSAA